MPGHPSRRPELGMGCQCQVYREREVLRKVSPPYGYGSERFMAKRCAAGKLALESHNSPVHFVGRFLGGLICSIFLRPTRCLGTNKKCKHD